jgi:PKD repeat protein
MMKKTIQMMLSAAALALLLTGCGVDPVADFTYDPSEVTVYDEVTFTNTSTDADSYSWDFGDLYTSTDENPVHMYKRTGTFTVTLTASNDKGDNQTQQEIVVGDVNNTYTIDGTVYNIESDMFWYTPPMGGDPYIRLLTAVPGQANPDLLKLYPNKGLGELPGTYTWDPENPVGTYDHGYTANYQGMSYDWTAIGKEGSGDLVITEIVPGVYKFAGEMVMSIGAWDFSTGEFTETSTGHLTLDYIGAVTPLE